ncbi:hypothetical protein [Paraglaciecola sp. 20A4]|uniref:hypothetical protein n=1 Tax=Paraglaciecola sp. 20A4 TaxID=2687288 RepID=UPI00140CEB4A|nr:hypothetical protein [Paraglaciecola sp. 20A4]
MANKNIFIELYKFEFVSSNEISNKDISKEEELALQNIVKQILASNSADTKLDILELNNEISIIRKS